MPDTVPRRQRLVTRSLSIAERHSKAIDRAAADIGLTFSAVLNGVLAGTINLDKYRVNSQQ